MDDFQSSFSTPFYHPLLPRFPIKLRDDLRVGTLSRNGIDVVTATLADKQRRADHARA